MTTKIENAAVAAKFASYPLGLRKRLLGLRELIYDVAASTKGVGEIEETLRWGEPAYLTSASKSGSLIRIDILKSMPSHYAMYFHCQTNLIDSFKSEFPGVFRYSQNRAVIFEEKQSLPVDAIRACVTLALTYRMRS